jgi:hypothetical protein
MDIKIKFRKLNPSQINKDTKLDYDLPIITPSEFQNSLTNFINHKESKGVSTTFFLLNILVQTLLE